MCNTVISTLRENAETAVTMYTQRTDKKYTNILYKKIYRKININDFL